MKAIILVAFFVTFSVLTKAQKGINIEIIAEPGMTLGADYKNPDGLLSTNWIEVKKKFTFGFNTGLAIGYNFNDKTGFNLGVLYSKQGQNAEHTWTHNAAPNETLNRTLKINYLKIPLFFNYTSSPDKNTSFLFTAGIYYGFLLNYEIENKSSDTENNSISTTAKDGTLTSIWLTTTYGNEINVDQFSSEPFKSRDFGGILSAGIQFKIADHIFFPIMLSYQQGFMDIKNYDSKCEDKMLGYSYKYWGESADPNSSIPYRNALFCVKTGIKINL